MAAAERSRMEATARRFHESGDDADPGLLSESIHEDAEMTLVMTHFKPVRGREAIMDALYRDRESMLYSASVERLEWLDRDTVLLRGHARYAAEEGAVGQSTIWWLDEFRDGQLLRVRAFKDEASARSAYSSL
jgi:ketosteroid isomerase-like protein